MSLRVVKAASEAENEDAFHLARMLVLLGAVDSTKKTPETKARAVEGITKLAKLDFLLRYPVYLERALISLGQNADQLELQPRERTTVETKMVRFRYGPWDSRYRRWLGILSARGLIHLSQQGRKIEIGLTDAGRTLSKQIAGRPAFLDLARRGSVLAKAVGSMPATRLKDFVYEVVPEITGMKWGEEIVVGPGLVSRPQTGRGS